MEINIWITPEDSEWIEEINNITLKKQQIFDQVQICFENIQQAYDYLTRAFPFASFDIHIQPNSCYINNLDKHIFQSETIEPNLPIPQYTQNEMVIKGIRAYRCRNGTFLPYSKEDIDSLIDADLPETFIPILEIMDYPYIIEQWEDLRKTVKEKYKQDDASVFRRYIAKMNLKGFKCFGFKDSEFINELNEERRKRNERIKNDTND